jgi:hypothetical protein
MERKVARYRFSLPVKANCMQLIIMTTLFGLEIGRQGLRSHDGE